MSMQLVCQGIGNQYNGCIDGNLQKKLTILSDLNAMLLAVAVIVKFVGKNL